MTITFHLDKGVIYKMDTIPLLQAICNILRERHPPYPCIKTSPVSRLQYLYSLTFHASHLLSHRLREDRPLHLPHHLIVSRIISLRHGRLLLLIR